MKPHLIILMVIDCDQNFAETICKNKKNKNPLNNALSVHEKKGGRFKVLKSNRTRRPAASFYFLAIRLVSFLFFTKDFLSSLAHFLSFRAVH